MDGAKSFPCFLKPVCENDTMLTEHDGAQLGKAFSLQPDINYRYSCTGSDGSAGQAHASFTGTHGCHDLSLRKGKMCFVDVCSPWTIGLFFLMWSSVLWALLKGIPGVVDGAFFLIFLEYFTRFGQFGQVFSIKSQLTSPTLPHR